VERISPGHLFEDQLVGASSPLYWVMGVGFLLLLTLALYVFFQADRRFAGDRFHRRLARRFAAAVASFSGLGLASTLFAILAVPFLSKRLWTVLALAGLLGTALYGLFYARRRYPAARQAVEAEERRRRYLPRPRATPRKKRARRR
jgi:hypothetical protein